MKTTILAFALITAMQAAELKVGKSLTEQKAVSLAELTAKPDAYVGKKLQVKGKITEVCQVMGCWIMLTDGNGAMMRIQMEEGEVAFPKDAAGRSAVAEGTLARYELSKEQALKEAEHEAKDAGKPFHPESVTNR